MTRAALDLHLTPEQRDLYEATRELAAETLKPIADAGTPGRVNRPLVAALAEHGLLARLFDGGQASAIELCLIREALARGCTDAETAFALQGLGAYPILQAGPPALRDEWIPRVADGTAVAAFALTEPDAGSDPAALRLQPRPTARAATCSAARSCGSPTRPRPTSTPCLPAARRAPGPGG